jgi:aspartokinase-like uncharacterized kinase
MPEPLWVIKVGGSLYELPDLGSRLRRWLATVPTGRIALLIPGGGPTADVVRDLDRRHNLGDERAHWLALRACALNAFFLGDLLARPIVADPIDMSGVCAVLDPYAFIHSDERQRGPILSHCWDFTSDSVAAHVAVARQAERLVLLKSVTIPDGLEWSDAGRRGLVDGWFAAVLSRANHALEVQAVNLRTLQPPSAAG